MSEDGPKVEEVKEDVKIEEVDSDEELPELEEATGADEEEIPEGQRPQSRSEKKARKAMLKHSLTPVPDVQKILVKAKDGSIMFVVNQPDVYQSTTGNSFVFFGQAVNDDTSAAALQQQAAAMQASLGAEETQEEGAEEKAAAPVAEESGDVDMEGVNSTHVDVIMEQVEGITRGQAVEALKKANGDVVNAIMELSMA